MHVKTPILKRPPQWTELERHLAASAAPAVFDPSSCEDLAEPVRRFLRAAIADGTELLPGARLQMRGSIRLGRWLPFRAEQLLAPAGHGLVGQGGRRDQRK